MPTTRRRAESEFEATQTQGGPQTLTLSSLTGGYNGYTNPELLSPQFWGPPSANIYSGLHGGVRRARWAPIVTPASLTLHGMESGVRMESMYAYYPASGTTAYLILDTQNSSIVPPAIVQMGTNISFAALNMVNNSTISNYFGPYMRVSLGGTPMIFQTNGLIRSKLFFNPLLGPFTYEYWGIDSADSSPQITLSSGYSSPIVSTTGGVQRVSNIVTVTLSSGTCPPAGYWVSIAGVTDPTYDSPTGVSFLVATSNLSNQFTYFQVGPNSISENGTVTVGITKNTGRSYQYAWENANTGHVSAPSPASQYAPYSGQIGTIDCVEVGTVAVTAGSPTVTGTNTAFTSAWIGKRILVETENGFSSDYIIAVSSVTRLTVASNWSGSSPLSGQRFAIFDAQSTHVRLYATGDGQTVYLRIQRNAVTPYTVSGPTTRTLAQAGLEFLDTDNSEPPNGSFTTELAQDQNVPPPIGSFLDDYQGRVIVYGVLGALQSFFYSNIETTVVGQPPESFAPLNEITLPIGDGEIYGSANLPTGFLIWSNRQDMFKLTGTLTDNTVANAQQLGATIQKLPYRIGCASPYGRAVTSLGAFWLSSDREVWLFTDHYAPKNIGKPIQNLLNQATRIGFARMKNYKAGDRNWLCLAITIGNGTYNNTLCILDLDLLSSNGQPSFFTFDMATNQPSWYIYNINCECIESAFDNSSVSHLLAGDIDLVTDLDWTDGYYTVSSEQSVPTPQLTLQAIGNEDPEVIKTARWMRVTTNQLPQNLSSQGWNFNILSYDDDRNVLGINPLVLPLVPGVDSPNQVFGLEYSPAVFRFGGFNFVKGRRFQIQTNFPSFPGFYELRGFQFSYDRIVER